MGPARGSRQGAAPRPHRGGGRGSRGNPCERRGATEEWPPRSCAVCPRPRSSWCPVAPTLGGDLGCPAGRCGRCASGAGGRRWQDGHRSGSAVDGVTSAGWAAAYPCDDGLPRTADGPCPAPTSTTTDVYASAWSNRLIVESRRRRRRVRGAAPAGGDHRRRQRRHVATRGVCTFANRPDRHHARPPHRSWRRGPSSTSGSPRRSATRPSSATSPSRRGPPAGFVTAYGCDGGGCRSSPTVSPARI